MNLTLNPHKNPMGVALGLVAIMFLATSIFFYMLFFAQPYLTYQNVPFPPTLEYVAPGDIMPLTVVRCNSDPVPHTYMTTRSLERVNRDPKSQDPEYILLQPVLVAIAPGCTTSISMANQLPAHVPPGRYRLIGAAEVATPIRSHTVEWSSQEFMVVTAKK